MEVAIERAFVRSINYQQKESGQVGRMVVEFNPDLADIQGLNGMMERQIVVTLESPQLSLFPSEARHQ